VAQTGLYRGVLVWNRTKKRDVTGDVNPTPRSASEWMRFDRPDLRIVSDEPWEAAHARLRRARTAMTTAIGNRAMVRRDYESKYLLTGFARCTSDSEPTSTAASRTGSGARRSVRTETSSQNVHIRLYHREAGKETGGWYTAAGSGAVDEPAVPDGEHLRLRGVSDGPIIDVMFDPGKQRWAGTWTHGGKSQAVILDRPHADPGALPNVLVGDWEGLPDPVGPARAATRLHIYQSADGTLTAWMDRVIALIDQRRMITRRPSRSLPNDVIPWFLKCGKMPATGRMTQSSIDGLQP
jgi:hypothetical protein